MKHINYRKFIKKTFRASVKVILREEQGVKKNKDPECIHQLRVALRKLAASFELFQDVMPGQLLKKWKKDIGIFSEVLGKARDIDVQIEFLKDFKNRKRKLKNSQGMDVFILILSDKRSRFQPQVIKAIDEFDKSLTIKKIEKEIKILPFDFKKYKSRKFYRHAKAKIEEKVNQLLVFEEFVQNPDAVEQLHNMRVAAKHLRYLLEQCGCFYADRLDVFIESARYIQKALGSIHDFDVWINKTVPEVLAGAGKNKELIDVIDYFRNECINKRSREYKTFALYWKKIQLKNCWAKLIKTVNCFQE
ncbi:MAG: CHAD domain-containing protein [Candidatus Omnitrophica bacterium]|nr:CHAD domain-containing protein [Candidatus Omnitrophota bacterium]